MSSIKSPLAGFLEKLEKVSQNYLRFEILQEALKEAYAQYGDFLPKVKIASMIKFMERRLQYSNPYFDLVHKDLNIISPEHCFCLFLFPVGFHGLIVRQPVNFSNRSIFVVDYSLDPDYVDKPKPLIHLVFWELRFFYKIGVDPRFHQIKSRAKEQMDKYLDQRHSFDDEELSEKLSSKTEEHKEMIEITFDLWWASMWKKHMGLKTTREHSHEYYQHFEKVISSIVLPSTKVQERYFGNIEMAKNVILNMENLIFKSIKLKQNKERHN